MNAILILVLMLVLAACGGNGGSGAGSSTPPTTDTTELHGNTARGIYKGTVQSIQLKAEKFILASDDQTIMVKAHPTVFLQNGEEVGFENLTVSQTVTVSGVQNPGIIKADTVWLEE